MPKRAPYLKPDAIPLSVSNPELVEFWHEDNTVELSVISAGSQHIALWHCPNGLPHSFRRKVFAMVVRTRTCPKCTHLELEPGFNDLATMTPELAAEWSPRNSLKATEVTTVDQKTKYWWIGSTCEHEWDMPITARHTMGQNCPYCASQRVLPGFNDFASAHPEYLHNWSSELNGDLLPTMVTRASRKEVWWRCDGGHDIKKSPKEWVYSQCGYCSGRLLLKGYNDLFTKAPYLAGEWDYERNTLDPKELRFNYREKAHWICSVCSHSWSSVVRSRSAKHIGCPKCANESKLEAKVLEALQSVYSGVIEERRKPLRTSEGRHMELDFWLPELRLAFEVQDFATHSRDRDDELNSFRVKALKEEFKKGPAYHELKRRLAREQLGVTLVDIWEDQILVAPEELGALLMKLIEEHS